MLNTRYLFPCVVLFILFLSFPVSSAHDKNDVDPFNCSCRVQSQQGHSSGEVNYQYSSGSQNSFSSGGGNSQYSSSSSSSSNSTSSGQGNQNQNSSSSGQGNQRSSSGNGNQNSSSGQGSQNSSSQGNQNSSSGQGSQNSSSQGNQNSSSGKGSENSTSNSSSSQGNQDSSSGQGSQNSTSSSSKQDNQNSSADQDSQNSISHSSSSQGNQSSTSIQGNQNSTSNSSSGQGSQNSSSGGKSENSSNSSSSQENQNSTSSQGNQNSSSSQGNQNSSSSSSSGQENQNQKQNSSSSQNSNSGQGNQNSTSSSSSKQENQNSSSDQDSQNSSSNSSSSQGNQSSSSSQGSQNSTSSSSSGQASQNSSSSQGSQNFSSGEKSENSSNSSSSQENQNSTSSQGNQHSSSGQANQKSSFSSSSGQESQNQKQNSSSSSQENQSHPSSSSGQADQSQNGIAISDGGFKGCFSKVYAFGDSSTDTGNCGLVEGTKSFIAELLNKSPYGCTTKLPGQRMSNGRLVIDFLTEVLGLPPLPPYKYDKANFSFGVNFAIGGATCLPTNVYTEGKITLSLMWRSVPQTFQTEIDWFNQYYQSQACAGNQCQPEMEETLFWVGGIGTSDYQRIAGSTNIGVKWLTDQAVGYVYKTLKTLLDRGARYVVVQGLSPLGCSPLLMQLFPQKDRDVMGCATRANSMIQAHNDLLQRRLQELRGQYSNCHILYADTWGAYEKVLTNYKEYNFVEPFKACCGVGKGSLNFDAKTLCGTAGTSRCQDPNQYIIWDGVHFTEAMHKQLSELFFHGGFCQPSFDTMIKAKRGH